MKLLIINYEYPPLGGGAGNATYHIAREMSQKGHDVIVVTSRFKGQKKVEKYNRHFTIIRIPTLRQKKESVTLLELLIFTLSSLIYCPGLVKRLNPDSSIAFFGIPCGITSLWLKLIYGLPYVVSLRGADVPGFVERKVGFFHFVAKPLIKYIWHQAKAVITNSKGLRDLALNSFKNKPIHIIPNGVDTEFFFCNIQYPPKDVRILFVGRLSKQKGLFNLIKSIKILQYELNKNYLFEIVGEGPDKEELLKMTQKNGLSKSIQFSGWLDKQSLCYKYQQATAFAFPSLSEGMPNAVLEAMATGLPVIATKVAGNEELIRDGENGYLVPANDCYSFAQKVDQMVNEPSKLKMMSQKSREIAMDEYSWEHVADEYINLINQCNNNC